jgi:hypothetical protein
MSDGLQWAIIAIIVLGIAYVVFRGGTANPQSTGALGAELRRLQGQVAQFETMSTQIGAIPQLAAESTAMKGRMTSIERDLVELKRDGATVKDIARVEEIIRTVRAEAQGHRDLSAATSHSVDRIERLLLDRSLDR